MSTSAFGSPDLRLTPPPAPSADLASAVSAPDLDRSTPFTQRANPPWRRRYAVEIAALDLVAAVAAALLILLLPAASPFAGVPDGWFAVAAITSSVALAAMWILLVWLSGVYDHRVLDVGNEAFTRIPNAGVRFFALLAAATYLLDLEVSKTIVLLLPTACTLLALLSHFLARASLRRERRHGAFQEDVLIVGTATSVTALVRHFRRANHSGYNPVGALVDTDEFVLDVDGQPIPILGRPRWVEQALENTLADVIAVADAETLGEGALRTLAWDLEGTGVELIVAPAMTEVAGPRVAVRPVAGLPLLHVEEPELTGPARIVKGVVDRVVALVGIVALSPLLLLIAVAIRATSEGPSVFRQERLGRRDRAFCVWKFRTMYVDAEQRLASLLEQNESSGALFKMRDDPRTTPIGRWLRRFSLDELPQLFNVLRGEMSLIGPRPLAVLPHDDLRSHERAARRRHLVKPGITGLWQVSGRSDLSWEDWVRLDLYYVENWSIALDISILLRTFKAVASRRGAY